jgi:hypothetical protein
MTTQLDAVVEFLSGREGEGPDRIRLELADPESDAVRFLDAARRLSGDMFTPHFFKKLGLPPSASDHVPDVPRPQSPPPSGRRLLRILPWLTTAVALGAVLWLVFTCPCHRQSPSPPNGAPAKEDQRQRIADLQARLAAEGAEAERLRGRLAELPNKLEVAGAENDRLRREVSYLRQGLRTDPMAKDGIVSGAVYRVVDGGGQFSRGRSLAPVPPSPASAEAPPAGGRAAKRQPDPPRRETIPTAKDKLRAWASGIKAQMEQLRHGWEKAVAAAVQQYTDQRRRAAEAENGRLRQQVAGLQRDLQAERTEKEKRQQEIAGLRAQTEQLSRDRDEARNKLQEQQRANEGLQKDLSAVGARATKMTTERDRLNRELLKASRDLETLRRVLSRLEGTRRTPAATFPGHR